MRVAIDLSARRMRENRGGPFASVIVRDGKIIARGWNEVTSANDPTAHGEVMAIRKACKKLGRFDLRGCEIFTNSEPCPMCMGAIYWARLDRVWYANTYSDAAAIGFDDSFIYNDLIRPAGKRRIPMVRIIPEKAIHVFEEWGKKPDKIMY
jgi:tRNA(Arg) A34 adenosine deaminase TadA